MRNINMRYFMTKLVITSALLIGSGSAVAQGGGAAQFGALGGTHAGNALACGATPEQAAKLRASHKAQAKTVFGAEAGFDQAYDTAEAQTQKKITDAWKKGQYKPTSEVCSELMKQVRS
ncbi:hypothetical protein B9Y64_03135 [Stenotrophomonas maltophilia]|uniref:DUF4148 domain-containing protein n=2 Tax=Lysobacteraceae TaxID=32033 RepID=A0A2J0UGV5_STEMA|nr:hypothetical protein B9Y64_03135 [Stenotrophomonas maltophilia]